MPSPGEPDVLKGAAIRDTTLRSPSRSPPRSRSRTPSRSPSQSPSRSSSGNLVRTQSAPAASMSSSADLSATPFRVPEFRMSDGAIAKMRQWIACFCFVDFDLDVGQKITGIMPPNAHGLLESELAQLNSMAFPDSNCTGVGDQLFCFRFPAAPERKSGSLLAAYAPKSTPKSTPKSARKPKSTSSRTSAALPATPTKPSPTKPAAKPSPTQPTKAVKRAISKRNHKITASLGYTSFDDMKGRARRSSSISEPEKRRALFFRKKRTKKKTGDRGNGEGREGGTGDVDVSLGDSSADLGVSVRETRAAEKRKQPTSVDMLYACVLFRQQRDSQNRRGFMQKSVVVVSPFPFTELFSKVIGVVGRMYFRMGETSVEAACQNISCWPRLGLGQSLSLPLLGELIEFKTPTLPRDSPFFAALGGTRGSTRSQQMPSQQILTAAGDLMGLFVHVNLYQSLFPVVHHLWHLWEVALTGEPLLVLGRTPASVSQCVLALVSIISPINFAGDFRPYFSVYSSDFKRFQKIHDEATELIPSLIVGGTNPFLLDAFQNFPNILSLSAADGFREWYAEEREKRSAERKTRVARKRRRALPSKIRVCSSLKEAKVDLLMPQTSSSAFVAKRQATFVPDESIFSRFFAAEDSLVDDDEDAETEPPFAKINGMVLRKHFYQLTQLFLMPFEHYFEFDTKKSQHLSPTWNPYIQVPSLPPFEAAEFLKRVKKNVEMFPMKGINRKARLSALYARFIKGPNFQPWFNSQRDLAISRMRAHMRSRLVSLRGKSFVLLVCHIAMSVAKNIRSRAQRYMDKVLSRAVLDKELHDAIQDHLNTLDALLPPPRRAPLPPIKTIKSKIVRASLAPESSAPKAADPDHPPADSGETTPSRAEAETMLGPAE